MRTKFLKTDAYKEFLDTGELKDTILVDFDQSGFWTLWAQNSQTELEEALGQRDWELLEHRLKSLKLSPESLEYTNPKGEKILKTSFHERPNLKPCKPHNELHYPKSLNIDYHIINGCLKLSTATKVAAPNLKRVGSIVLTNGGISPKKVFSGPELTKIAGDLRAWRGVEICCDKLNLIGGNFILEDNYEGVPHTPKTTEDPEIHAKNHPNLPNLKKIGGSIYCRNSKTLSLPNLEHVGGGISGYMTERLSLPKLREVKSLRLDLTKINKSEIINLISNLSNGSLENLQNDYQKHPSAQKVSIANPAGPTLHNIIRAEKIKRKLLNYDEHLTPPRTLNL